MGVSLETLERIPEVSVRTYYFGDINGGPLKNHPALDICAQVGNLHYLNIFYGSNFGGKTLLTTSVFVNAAEPKSLTLKLLTF